MITYTIVQWDPNHILIIKVPILYPPIRFEPSKSTPGFVVTIGEYVEAGDAELDCGIDAKSRGNLNGFLACAELSIFKLACCMLFQAYVYQHLQNALPCQPA